MPGPIAGDAVHVAAATIHAARILLSWSDCPLTNPNKTDHLQRACLLAGFVPRILTPEFLWETDDA